MSVETEAVSGPQDNAGSGKSVDPLDAAINAAFGGQRSDGDDIPPHLVKAKMEENDRKDSERRKNAGDARSASEDARAPGNKAEAAPAEATPQGEPEPREAPKHWPEERRKAFAGWPKEVQDHALAVDKDLQAGFTRKSQELSDQAKFAETVRGLFKDGHRQQQLAQAGLDEVGAIQYLTSLQDFATRDPARYVQWFMQQTGLTPAHLGFNTRAPEQHQHAPQHQAPRSTGDPQLDALLAADPATEQLRSQFGQFSQAAIAEINALKHHIAQRQHQEQEYARQSEIKAQQGLLSVWNTFRSDQDDHGQLKYPHADTLRQQMGAIMQTDPQIAAMPDNPAKLDAAYQAALWARPDLRSGLLEQERSRAAAEAQKKAEAERAKKAAAVKPASGAPTMPAKKGGLDAALNAAFAQIGGN